MARSPMATRVRRLRGATTAAALAMAMAAMILAAPAVVASVCRDESIVAPNVTTLTISPTNKSEAWVRHTNCLVDVIPLEIDPAGDGKSMILNCTGHSIEHVESMPEAARVFFSGNSGFESGDFSNHDEIIHMLFSGDEMTTLDDITFPPNVVELDLVGNKLKGISEGKLPDAVEYLYLNNNKLKSLDNFVFPSSLRHLYLGDNYLENVGGGIPNGLVGLYMDRNTVKEMKNTAFPDSMVNFSCVGCGIKAVSGIEFSYQLQSLNLDDNRILEFEIREADVEVFKNMEYFQATITQSECRDSSADKLKLDNGSLLCVISDALFEQKYGSLIDASDASSNALGVDSNFESPSSSNSPVIIVVAVIAGVVGILVAVIAYRSYNRPSDGKQYATADTMRGNDNTDTMMQTFGTSSGYTSQEYLSNDVRNDEELIPFRIGQNDIVLGNVIAKGGFGVVYMAKFHDRTVAVKQLRPDKARVSSAIKGFMDEIRMCAQLEHPKIVQFVGISWSNLLDLAVVIEYMGGGDLTTILHSQKWEPKDWFEPSPRLKNKILVARDVVEALVYLHSFKNPILHRDLKTRNVLMTTDGDAKLSDFGISRELPMDETMTGEVGTVAWIAPEVLQGERYSEKADIYSFGVVLAELDTGLHPYDNDLESEETNQMPSSHTNTRIAMLVSAGALKPTMTKKCPREVKELAMRCMNYEPEGRPTAVELHYELSKMQSSWDDADMGVSAPEVYVLS